ncbi:MAG: ABC transporter ATP-binding protein [Ruminiclostridium sp.]|nr:ABC transporter ATP-binding protein [Ruminiclostridium sp.]
MVQIRGLQKSYKNFKVLDGLDMTINKGDVYGFLGKNGCGKSTTMNIICNIIPKDEGEIILGENGEDVKIGYLPETPALFGYMNGYEYLEYIASCANYQGDTKKRIAEVMEITGMTEGGKRRIKGYSRGMNQRMGIAATIFNNPDLIILDEPTSALDPEGRAEVMSIINNLTQTGATILLCTHILSDVERVSNRIGIMKNGRLAIEDTIASVKNRFMKNSIEINLANPTEDSISVIRNAEFAKDFQFFPHSALAVFDVENPDEGMVKTMKLLSENGIAASRIQTTSPTLEQIYIQTVSDGNTGRGNF